MKRTLRDARLKACRMWGAASHAILTLVPVEKPGLGTMAVDQYWRLYYDPELLDKEPLDHLASIILHEVSHCLFRHHKRAEQLIGKTGSKQQFHLWNVAGDYAINSMLREEGIKLDGIYPEQSGLNPGLSAEEYFRELQRNAQEKGQDGQPGQEGEGEPGEAKPELGQSGSCSDGQPRPWEDPPPAKDGEPGGPPGLKPHEQEVIVRQVAQKIAEKSQGRGSAAHRWATGVLQPKVDPKAALMHLVRHAVEVTSGTGEYSFRRPNRRNPSRTILRPSNVQPVPRITVIVDTSGSMDAEDLGLSLGLIGKVLNGFRIRDGIRVVCGDTAVASVSRVFDPRQMELCGGGGTDMGHLIVEAARLKPRPQLIVVCTDGETGWCDPVGVPVVACVTRQRRIAQVPKWIKAISLTS